MADIGTLARLVNSQAMKVYVTATTNQYIMLQDARMPIAHVELREPTTGIGSVYYSGQDDNSLSGTLLYTTDAWSVATIGFSAMLTRVNGEVPTKTLLIRFTDQQGTPVTEQYSVSAKLESYEPFKAAEGGVKVNVRWVIIGAPTVT